MVRNLLVLLVFLGVSFGANVAQSDIFLRKTPKVESTDEGESEAPKKKSIFLRPFKKDNPKTSRVRTNFRAKLNVKGVRRQIEQDLKTLDYWQKRGTKPTNIEEMRSYAFALRVDERATMLKERELTRVARANLERKHQDEFQRDLAVQAARVAEANALVLRAAQVSVVENEVVRTDYRVEPLTSKPKVRRVYVKPKDILEKPSRVFRDYR